jgi:hypothetical protein
MGCGCSWLSIGISDGEPSGSATRQLITDMPVVGQSMCLSNKLSRVTVGDKDSWSYCTTRIQSIRVPIIVCIPIHNEIFTGEVPIYG